MFWRGGRIGPRSNAFRCGKGRGMGGGGGKGGHNSWSSTIAGNHYLTDAAVDSIGRHVFVFVHRAISSLLSFFLLFYLLFSFLFSPREKEGICTIKVIPMKARRRGKSSSLSAIL